MAVRVHRVGGQSAPAVVTLQELALLECFSQVLARAADLAFDSQLILDTQKYNIFL